MHYKCSTCSALQRRDVQDTHGVNALEIVGVVVIVGVVLAVVLAPAVAGAGVGGGLIGVGARLMARSFGFDASRS
jgi:hypothetical protein